MHLKTNKITHGVWAGWYEVLRLDIDGEIHSFWPVHQTEEEADAFIDEIMKENK